MKKFKYVYVCPTKKGYREVTITKKQHNELIPSHKIDWRVSPKYYINDNRGLHIEFLHPWFPKLLMTILTPITYLIYGLKSIPEINSEVMDMWHETQRGKFRSEDVHTSHRIYKEFVKVCKEVK